MTEANWREVGDYEQLLSSLRMRDRCAYEVGDWAKQCLWNLCVALGKIELTEEHKLRMENEKLKRLIDDMQAGWSKTISAWYYDRADYRATENKYNECCTVYWKICQSDSAKLY